MSHKLTLTALLNDLALAEVPLVLVLDDYHLITNTAVHTAMILLIDRLPPRVHLVVTSRVEPPWLRRCGWGRQGGCALTWMPDGRCFCC